MAAIQYGQYKVAEAHECVNFGVGQPAPSMLPLAKVRDASQKKFAEEDPLFLQVRLRDRARSRFVLYTEHLTHG